jgi:hypothetical protein
MGRTREKQKYPIVHIADKKAVTSARLANGVATAPDTNRDSSNVQSSVSSKLPARSVVVDVRNADVDHIRAVLALKPSKRHGSRAGAWASVAVVVLLGAFADWQWTESRANAADNIAPPQITMPKPPDFAYEASAPNPPANAAPSENQPQNARTQSGSGN